MRGGLILGVLAGAVVGAVVGFLIGFVFPLVYSVDNLGPIGSFLTVPLGVLFGAFAGFHFGDTGRPTILLLLVLGVLAPTWMAYAFGFGVIYRLFFLLIIAVLCGSFVLRFGFDRGGFGGAMIVGLVGAALGAQLAMWIGLPMLIGTGVFGVWFDVLWSSLGMLALATILRGA